MSGTKEVAVSTGAGSHSQPKMISHFWVSSYPFFETTLLVARAPGVCPEPSRAFFYDSDGALFNEVVIDFNQGAVGILELEQFLGGCKIEGGLKHAHLEVRSSPGASHYCRMHTRSGACLVGEAQAVSFRKATFFPIYLAESRSVLLTLVNHTTSVGNVRCRLYFGKRLPEMSYDIAPLGCRVISINTEFMDYLGGEAALNTLAYLRVSSTSDFDCGAQIIEVISHEKDGDILSSIS